VISFVHVHSKVFAANANASGLFSFLGGLGVVLAEV
jgi:hypothetical protein